MEGNKKIRKAWGISGWLQRINTILLVMAMFLFYDATPAAAQCNVNPDLEVQGVTGSDGAIPFYGVWGYSSVWDATVQADSDYVNSVWIISPTDDRVELGWVDSSDGTRTFFRAWVIGGIYHDDFWGAPGVGTSHFFKLYNINADMNWHFIVDGAQRGSALSTSFYWGTAGAMRERHNSCDSGWAHWWTLKRCDYVCSWSLWQTLTERNYDPGWYLDPVSNSAFFVKKQ